MQRLRHARFLARLVLAWFALAIGVAVAAPVVGAGSLELVCSGAALKLVVKTADGGTAPAGQMLDCPLCVHADAPPGVVLSQPLVPRGLVSLAVPAGTSRASPPTAAPPPARGPPSQV
jgi:hypothetical protein